jgi:glutamyl-tRNA reductase
MSLAVFGISHRTAPIEVRERFAQGPDAQREFLENLVRAGAAEEAVLLSTCNRTELYVHLAPGRCPGTLFHELSRHGALDETEASSYLVRRHGRDAAEHLFRVSAGLESLVLGEAQIQGQVRVAYNRALERGDGVQTAGPVLSRLFQTALRVGARVRSETRIGAGAASVASAAVGLAAERFGILAGRRILVLGAGEMARLALACLSRSHPETVFIANRSPERAGDVAKKVAGTVIGLDQVPEVLPIVDVVIAATGAAEPVLTLAQVLAARSGCRSPLTIVDLGMPRNVEPGVHGLADVQLFTTDDLRDHVQRNLDQRRSGIPAAERMVEEGVQEFWEWLSVREVVPLIRAVRDQAEAVRREEAERVLGKLAHLSPEDRETVDALTRRILNKLLHLPTVRLRGAPKGGGHNGVVEAARYLFDLEEAPLAPLAEGGVPAGVQES